MPEPTTRPYRSAHRAEQARQTRAAVLTAAREIFAERGWAGAGIRDIAAAAGVSVETVYAAVGRKPALFVAAYNGAIVGDDEPVALAERPQYRVIGTGEDLATRATAAAALLVEVNGRTARLVLALREGAANEPLLAQCLAVNDGNRHAEVTRGLGLVLRRTPTRAQVDVLWAVGGADVYTALVRQAGWTTSAYQAWLARTIIGLEDLEQP